MTGPGARTYLEGEQANSYQSYPGVYRIEVDRLLVVADRVLGLNADEQSERDQ